jgi:glycosyltransferase involved in cell wall biosynthesis
MIEHHKNGLLADFFDVEGLADAAEAVLNAPLDYKHLGQVGMNMVRERYSLEVCLPKMLDLYEEATHAKQGK